MPESKRTEGERPVRQGTAGRRWLKSLVAAALLLLVGAVVIHGLATAPAPGRAQPLPIGEVRPTLTPAALAPASTAPGSSRLSGTSAPLDAQAAAPFDPTARWLPALASALPRPGQVDYCGLGVAAAGSPAAKTLAQQAAAQAQAAGERLFNGMRQSSDPRTRAAAQLALDEKDALADTARLTRDPTVYALAVQACSRGAADARTAACGALSAGQMAQLDPGNVVPWLHVATEALVRGDLGGVAEATHRASLARESRLREYAFADLALSAIPPEWPPRDAMLASARVLEIHASLALPSYLAVVKRCAKERMADSNLQQTCDRLARVLTTQGDSLVDYGIGRRLGEWAGWTADVVEAHNARFEAFKQTQTDGDALAASVPVATGCNALGRGVRLAYAHAHLGERAFAESELLRTAVDDAEILRRYRARPQAVAAASAAGR